MVASLDFRVPPVASYPACLADINYAIRWFKTQATALGSRPDLVGVMGTSSGAHLAMLGAMRPRDARYAAIPLAAGMPAVDATVRAAVLCWPVIDPLGRYHYAKALKASGQPYPEVVDRVLLSDQSAHGKALAKASVRAQSAENAGAEPSLYIRSRTRRSSASPPLPLRGGYRKAGGEVSWSCTTPSPGSQKDLDAVGQAAIGGSSGRHSALVAGRWRSMTSVQEPVCTLDVVVHDADGDGIGASRASTAASNPHGSAYGLLRSLLPSPTANATPSRLLLCATQARSWRFREFMNHCTACCGDRGPRGHHPHRHRGSVRARELAPPTGLVLWCRERPRIRERVCSGLQRST